MTSTQQKMLRYATLRYVMIWLKWKTVLYTYNIMIAGIPFVLAGQLKTNTPHCIHFF